MGDTPQINIIQWQVGVLKQSSSGFCDAGPHLVLAMMQHNFGAAGDLLEQFFSHFENKMALEVVGIMSNRSYTPEN